MDVRELDGGSSAASLWLAPKLVMLTAIGDSEGGIISGLAEKISFTTTKGAIIKGSVYGVSG